MKKQIHKIFVALLLSLLTLAGIYLQESGVIAGNHGDNLKVHMLDVGQGDSFLIQAPDDTTILIDGGQSADVLYEIGKVMPYYDQTVEVMILTHPHNDHVNGLNDVIDRYDVGHIYHSGVVHTLPAYTSWLQRIKDNDIANTIISEPLDLVFNESMSLEFIYPRTDLSGERVDNLNNASLVVRLKYKNASFLFTGDIEEEVEEELLESGIDLSADVLKAPHHGSTSSSTESFIDAVNPSIVLITAGKNNKYSHPHNKILRRFERRGIDIYRTDIHGTITVETDGETIGVD